MCHKNYMQDVYCLSADCAHKIGGRPVRFKAPVSALFQDKSPKFWARMGDAVPWAQKIRICVHCVRKIAATDPSVHFIPWMDLQWQRSMKQLEAAREEIATLRKERNMLRQQNGELQKSVKTLTEQVLRFGVRDRQKRTDVINPQFTFRGADGRQEAVFDSQQAERLRVKVAS